MTISATVASQNAMLDAFWNKADGGTGVGYILIKTSGGTTLLATLLFSATAFAAAVGGSKTANAITGDTGADATGTAAVCEFYDGDDVKFADGSVGLTGEDINFDDITFVAGQPVDISSMVVNYI